jgi:hypothetical protein
MWPVTGLLHRIRRGSAQSSIVSITGQGCPRRSGPVAMGNLYLHTHVSAVILLQEEFEAQQFAIRKLWREPWEIPNGCSPPVM